MGPLADPATWVIDGPVIWLILFFVALAVASALVRLVPSIRGTLTTVTASRQTAIDGLRGVLGISVFIHHTVIT